YPAIIDPDIAPIGPTKRLEPLAEGPGVLLSFRIVCTPHPNSDLGHSAGLLRPRRQRPRRRRAAEQGDDLATPHHSITSSARASRVAGTSSLSAFAVLRLIDSTYFTGVCTGRSAGFSPFRIRST